MGLRGLEPATRRLSAPAGKFRMRRPTLVEGIEKYLASGMIRGIGPVYVQKLMIKEVDDQDVERRGPVPHFCAWLPRF